MKNSRRIGKDTEGFSPEQKANISLYQIWEKEFKERMMQKAVNKLNPKEKSMTAEKKLK